MNLYDRWNNGNFTEFQKYGHKPTKHKARKEYFCYICGKSILKGQEYIKVPRYETITQRFPSYFEHKHIDC